MRRKCSILLKKCSTCVRSGQSVFENDELQVVIFFQSAQHVFEGQPFEFVFDFDLLGGRPFEDRLNPPHRRGHVRADARRFVLLAVGRQLAPNGRGREVLYVVTFCLPRFLDQPFADKLVTVFHELYHIGPAFDGDLRRHPGRYAVHSHSKRAYDARMGELVRDYLAEKPDPELFAFLRHGYADLWKACGGLYGVVVPRPKLLPLAWRLPVACSENMAR